MAKILVLNGPNLNLLGSREPTHYGSLTLADIEASVRGIAEASNVALEFRQSNAEHQLVEWIQQAPAEGVSFVVINPAAFTHTSVAIRDAFAGVAIPFIEVHISNVHAREPFRKHSYLSDLAVGVIAGLGAQGYDHAMHSAIQHIGND